MTLNAQTPTAKAPHLSVTSELQAQLDSIDKSTGKDGFKKIVVTKEIFEEINRSLTETLKSMEKNPSILTRTAEFWGTLPLWQKITGGLVLSTPTLIIGIAAHIGFLLALCGVTVITYATGGIILDDHHKCTRSVTKGLEKGILSLARFLELTISALREQLEKEIQKFTQENTRLIESITLISNQIDLLDSQVKKTSGINEQLDETKDELGETAHALKENVLQQTDLLNKNQQKLAHITEAPQFQESCRL